MAWIETYSSGLVLVLSVAFKREHSRTPEGFYTLVEAKVELHARHVRDAWRAYRHELP